MSRSTFISQSNRIMKQLKELTKIVTRKKLMRLSIIGQSTDSKLDQLYELIVDQKVSSDDEAAQILYQKTASFSPYQKVKSKLKARLAEMTLLIDVNQPINGNANLAYREAWHLWSIANQLMSRSARTATEEYAKKALKLALDYEHIDLVVKISKFLRKNAATYLGDENLFDHYNEMYHNYLQASLAEAKVEECYEKVMILLVREKSNNKAIAELGEQLYVELEPLLNKFDQLSIHRFIRYIQVTYLLNSFAYQETIEASQKALDFFETKKFNLQNTIIGFLIHQLICYTQLKKYKLGRESFNKCLVFLGDKKNSTFFKVNELGLILFLHNTKYQEAYKLCLDTLNTKSLRQEVGYCQEAWRINGAYIHYLIYIGKVTPLEDDKTFTTFRLGKFLNEVPVFSKDKRGMNIPILIIQFLFTIVMGKYDQAFDRIEAIERYVSRYIKKDEHYRSNCFIKMLLIIPKQGFHKLAVIRHTEKLRKKLSEVPLEIANQIYEVEMIPYEDLWQMALDSLGLKHIKLKR